VGEVAARKPTSLEESEFNQKIAALVQRIRKDRRIG
jgi:hypothetical protein